MALRLNRAIGMCVLLAVSSVAPAAGIEAISRPSQDVVLSFVQPGRIAEVPAKVGDTVKAGDVLVRQDDAAEQIRLKQLKAEADDETRIEATVARAKQQEVVLAKTRKARQGGGATELEVQEAEVAVTIAKLSITLARFEQQQAKRKYEEEKARVDRMVLTNPIDGRAEVVGVEVGESVEANEKIVRVVQINPLWVDVPVPRAQAADIKVGQAAAVEFDDSPDVKAVGTRKPPVRKTGKVTFVASVIDAASDTRTVRVEVPNGGSAQRPAGERVRVSFPKLLRLDTLKPKIIKPISKPRGESPKLQDPNKSQ